MTSVEQNELLAAADQPFAGSVRHYDVGTTIDLRSESVFPVDTILRAEATGSGLLAGWIDCRGVAGLAASDAAETMSWVVHSSGRAVVVPRAEVDRLLDVSPAFNKALRSWLFRACEEARHDAICHMQDSASKRVIRLLTKLSEISGPGGLIPISQSEIGTLLGLQRTTVCGVMTRLRDLNVINYRRGQVSIVRSKTVSGIA